MLRQQQTGVLALLLLSVYSVNCISAAHVYVAQYPPSQTNHRHLLPHERGPQRNLGATGAQLPMGLRKGETESYSNSRTPTSRGKASSATKSKKKKSASSTTSKTSGMKTRKTSKSGKGKKSKANSLRDTDSASSDDAEDFCHSHPKISDRREWPAADFFNNTWYLKTYQLRGVGKHIEIWVADDVAFPNPDDCRNALKTTEVTDKQVDRFILEFDNVMYPSITSEWLVPKPRDGTKPNLNATFAENATECTFRGDGDRIVTLVDNVRDERFYTPLNGKTMPYIIGFYNDIFDSVTDRSIMTINVYDWLHRTGPYPPNNTDIPKYQECAALIGRKRTFEPQPYTYEATFAHEFGHLLDGFVEGERETWLGEMLAEYATYLAGYGVPSFLLDPSNTDFDPYMEVILGFSDVEHYGGPEQSLSTWLDQGQPEVLADYSAVRGFGLYMTGRFGRSFLGEFSTVANATNLQDLQDFLAAQGEEASIQTIIQDWLVASAVSSELTQGASLESNGRAEEDLVMPLVPLSRVNWDTYQAYNSSGAPINGADYVRFRDVNGIYVSANEVERIEFLGSEKYESAPVEWVEEDNALYSGTGDSLDRFMALEVTIPEDGSRIALDLSWEIELNYDFFFVQLLDGEGQWTTLPHGVELSNSTDTGGSEGLTGSSGGRIVTHIYDASSFAGETTYLALRYVTDESIYEDGVRLFGIAFLGDDGISSVAVVENATSASSWVLEEPLIVNEWIFTLVAYTQGGSLVYVNDIPLDANGGAVLEPPLLTSLIGSDSEIVAAIVSVGTIDDTLGDYAKYELKVNGIIQPGGSRR